MSTAGDSFRKQTYDPDANVYVAGLPRDFDQNKLYSLFIGFGEILRFKFVASKDESKCSYGFVQFVTPTQAQRAIKALNGHCVNGRGGGGGDECIQLSIAAVGRRTLPSEEPTNLYIENMPASWNNEQLAHVFGRFGTITQSKITGNNVAFVRFETHQQALNAINHINRKIVDADDAKPLIVRFATCQHKKMLGLREMSTSMTSPFVAAPGNDDQFAAAFPALVPLSAACVNTLPAPYMAYRHGSASPKSIRSGFVPTPPNENNLYVKNLPPNYNQEQLERLFAAFGAISSATIINDSVGVAFVRLKHARDAKRAIERLHGTVPPQFEQEIVVKFAHSDIDQQQQPQQDVCASGLFSLNGDAAPFTPRFMVVGKENEKGNDEKEKEKAKNKEQEVQEEQDSEHSLTLSHFDSRNLLLLVSGYIRRHLCNSVTHYDNRWSNGKVVLRTVFEFYASQPDITQSLSVSVPTSVSECTVKRSCSSDDVKVLFPRINSLDDGLHALRKKLDSMSASMSNMLFECEQKRVFELSVMQQTLDGVVETFYQHMHAQMAQMQSLTDMVQQQQLRHEQQTRSVQQEIEALRMEKIASSSSVDHKTSTSKTMSMTPSADESQLDRVKTWIMDIVGLPSAYYDVLVCHGYDDMESIRDLTDHDLLQIGITKIGHRKKIIKYVQQTSSSSSSSSSRDQLSVDSPPVYHSFHHLDDEQVMASLPMPLPLPGLNAEGDANGRKPRGSCHDDLNLNFEVLITPNVAESSRARAMTNTLNPMSDVDFSSFIDSIEW
eukprot:CAMPEP_0202712242 /NCGR_PEP_ID=MMETSP1385-20130828/36132_1 /ASSEMBLY_ACC=CAM_ASM_000861 /TAXON_ID=933848 /ORGANISM="Elphidium margaritaceum" /LENGTH=778 /DNA_ID=CAMNT_0049372211 /DNA_START=99 /DNA_END=2432 /DNA_ORIENTATION=+